MGRAPCCDKSKVKKGQWSPEEDETLKNYIETHGAAGNWIHLPKKAGLKRCGKSCRLRWLNYLRPDIKHGGFSEEEDNIICNLYTQIGSRWSVIASHMPGRTDNDVKNYWNTKLKKRFLPEKPRNVNPIAANNVSSLALPCAPKVENDSESAYSTFQALIPATLHMLSDANSGLSVYNSSQMYNSNPLGLSQFGASSVSLSQDGSSVSDSSSIVAMDKCGSVHGNGLITEDDYAGMDLGFGGLSCDFVNEMWFGEKHSEVFVDPTYSTSLECDFFL